MKINGEEVECVTDFSSLQAGMIIWVKSCGWCASNHRFMLTRADAGELVGSDGRVIRSSYWWVLPELHEDARSGPMVVADYAVGERRIYRVVDPLLDAKPVTRMKELAR